MNVLCFFYPFDRKVVSLYFLLLCCVDHSSQAGTQGRKFLKNATQSKCLQYGVIPSLDHQSIRLRSYRYSLYLGCLDYDKGNKVNLVRCYGML